MVFRAKGIQVRKEESGRETRCLSSALALTSASAILLVADVLLQAVGIPEACAGTYEIV